jgi:hypothetical protein
MKHLILAIALSALCITATRGADELKLPRLEQRVPEDIGKRLADQVPQPISTREPRTSLTTVRDQIFNRLATWQGVTIAVITLALTLIICRPRAQKLRAPSTPFTISSQDRPTKPAKAMTLVEQFNESMGMNYERWHDGLGYELSLIDKATPAERAEIEALLLKQPVTDWSLVEGLSRLRTPACVARLRDALVTSHGHEVKMAITEYAADLITTEQRTAAIIAAVREAPLLKGLQLALRQLPKFHPPEIIHELLQATLQREGDAAMHCAAHLLVIHGKAASPFAEPHRAFLSRFATKDPAARLAAHEELLELIKAD